MKTATNLYYVIATGFIVYFIISYVYKVLKVRNLEEALQTRLGLLLINLKHVIGIILFGLLFFFIAPEYRYLVGSIQISSWAITVLSVLILMTSGILAFNSAQKKFKTLIRLSDYEFKTAWLYFPIRLVFLFSYEFFFRGLIFFFLLQLFNLWIAILITTVLYVVIHGFDSRNEIIGAIPFGIVLCLFSYYSNSIWIAFVIHAALSVAYEWSIYKHLTLKKRTS